MKQLFETVKAKKIIKNGFFPLIKEDKATINKELDTLGIKQVKYLDDLGEDLDEIMCKAMTLLIIPQLHNCDEDGEKTIKELEKDGHKTLTKIHPVDLDGGTKKGYTRYYKDKNLVVLTINPFVKGDLLKKVLKNIKDQNIVELDMEEIQLEKLVVLWTKNANTEKKKTEERFKKAGQNMKSALDNYSKYHKDFMEIKKTMDSYIDTSGETRQRLVEEIKKVKNMPMVKLFEIGKGIKLSFGDCYINEQVRVGTQVIDGITMPKVDRKRVYIGELVFNIEDNKISVKNLNAAYDGYQHPHAVDGNQNMCTGEASIRMVEALNSLNLVQLAKLLYSWSISYNKNDAHCNISRFYNQNGSERK